MLLPYSWVGSHPHYSPMTPNKLSKCHDVVTKGKTMKERTSAGIFVPSELSQAVKEQQAFNKQSEETAQKHKEDMEALYGSSVVADHTRT